METLLAQLYPQRVPIAIVTVAAVLLVAVVGWRRGWHHALGRHRAATGVAIFAIAVVAVPLTWYLASPLFLRTELVEPAPVLGAIPPSAVASSAAPSRSLTAASPTPARPTPSATPSASPRPILRTYRGDFVGEDDFHFARGTARLVETAPGAFTLRLEAFSVRNGPDLYVYLSADPTGYADGAIELGSLKATDGSFNYVVPPGVDVEAIGSVVIWCRAFSVQFGFAKLDA